MMWKIELFSSAFNLPAIEDIFLSSYFDLAKEKQEKKWSQGG